MRRWARWSLANLMQEGDDCRPGDRAVSPASFLSSTCAFISAMRPCRKRWREELRDADIVIIHEWTEPAVACDILSYKSKYGFRALFHDTHHRAYTNAGEILRFPLHLFDGVLAFGEPIRRIYLDGFGVPRAWTFHEACRYLAFSSAARNHERSTCCGSATGATKSAPANSWSTRYAGCRVAQL